MKIGREGKGVGVDAIAQSCLCEFEFCWQVVGDVFRELKCPKLPYVMVGDGIQITGMAVVIIVFYSPW